LFVNCEAQSIYPYRSLLEEEQFKTCFNEYRDLMAAARVGRDRYVRQIAGYNTGEDDTSARYVPGAIFEIMWGTAINRSAEEEEPLTRARMSMCRVCVCLSRRTRKYFQVAKYLRRSSCMYVLGVYPFSS